MKLKIAEVVGKITVVLDTNVLISSFYGGNPETIIELFLNEEIDLYYSSNIIQEYRDVLFREKFLVISETKRNILISAIVDLGILAVPKQKLHVITKDPADNKFLECAATAKVDYLITGNTHHFDFKQFEGVKIVTPAQFLTEFKVE
jgi:putative PIN family toxin of toxin-antitoxin system